MDKPECLPGRDHVMELLRRDIMGPAPAGEAIAVPPGRKLSFEEPNAAFGPFVDADSGEEILCWERPIMRYGVGVLFPAGTTLDTTSGAPGAEEAPADEAPLVEDEIIVTEQAHKQLERMSKRKRRAEELEDSDDALELLETNTSRPSSMAVSFAVELNSIDELLVEASGGRYEDIDVTIKGRSPRKHHRRRPWGLSATVAASLLRVDERTTLRLETEGHGLAPLAMHLELVVRPELDGQVLLTAALVNRTTIGGGSTDERSAFQCQLTVTARRDGEPSPAIVPYPGRPWEQLDEEERTNELLYRKHRTFAVGHGCAADWTGLTADVERSSSVVGTPLPTYEVPSITPDLVDEDERPIEIPMAPLAGLVPGDDGLASAQRMIDAYDRWIARRREELADLEGRYQEVGATHIARCESALHGMKRGLQLVEDDDRVRDAFRAANHAILAQQLRTAGEPRRVTGRPQGGGGLTFDEPAPAPDMAQPPERRGRWRPFQLAFLLLCLPSIVDPQDDERATVELIWFPTGGGKTEAYLGLLAFTIVLRRLRDPRDAGTDILMRYTLRLLTAQQFQRASGVIVALEHLRRQRPNDLGETPISIGIWVGKSTSPNKNADAEHALRALLTGKENENKLLLNACPWCRAELGPISRKGRGKTQVLGYRKARTGGVEFHCSDANCTFSDRLPIHVVDEDIYATRPTMLIGTVDKFAMLAWRPQARRLFGLDESGQRELSPPTLIIQDELHLISGPLGTLVGLFETAVEELCTDRRIDTPIRPKIVSSTATIRSLADQVLGLYARREPRMFPPPGLDVADSFFARYATYEDGELREGRLYVGIHATNHDSLITTEVASLAALLQAPMPLGQRERDPWWTPLVFFNNLRELGTTLSLLASNVPGQLRLLANRHGFARTDLRYIDNVLELTSRLANDEVPRAIDDLLVRTDGKRDAVDCCLASNIIEVGVDIDRLSLMLVVGQPKSASQYIQVTGRVGRAWQERPGLVVTLLNPRRPRDRSHFEHFREFHQRLYASVEPTSVTPFAPSSADRALHGALAAVVRSSVPMDTADRPDRTPDDVVEHVRRLFLERVETIDSSEKERLTSLLDRRIRELRSWKRTSWESGWGADDDSEPMLVQAGSDTGQERTVHHWPTMMSMRTVDAECEVRPTMAYTDYDGAVDA